MSIQNWGDAIALAFVGAWQKFIIFIPELVAAIIVFVIGWIIAVGVGELVEKIIVGLHIDEGLERIDMGLRMRNIGWHLKISTLLGGLVKWFLILIFLLSAVNILGLTQVSDLLNKIILYIPNVVAAVIILAVAFLLGNFVYTIVRAGTEGMSESASRFISIVSKWSIVIFGILAALIQLGIAPSLVNTLFIGLVALIVIAGGLAFGLGGREEAALLLKRMRERMDKETK